MRFLLSDGNSAHEDGVYTFTLDQRLANATVLRVTKADFQYTPGVGTVAPHVVYMRSAALHKMAKNKHTVVLKNAQHVDSVDVIGVLEETHTAGRYRLRSWQPALRLNYTHLRSIDVYFTDTAGAVVGAQVESAGTSASDITGHASTFMFLDMEDSTKLTVDPASDLLTEIISTNDAALEFQQSGGSGIPYGDWGSTKAITFDEDYVQLRDDDGVAEPEQGFLCMLFESQPTVLASDDYSLVDFYRWRIMVAENQSVGQLTLNRYPASDAAEDSGIAVSDGTAYLLTIVRKVGTGYGDTYNFEWTLEDLDAETTATATSGSGDASSGTGLFSFGTSSYSNDGTKVGSVIMMSSTAAADVALAQDFLRARYTGAATSSSSSVDLSATFFAEVDIDIK